MGHAPPTSTPPTSTAPTPPVPAPAPTPGDDTDEDDRVHRSIHATYGNLRRTLFWFAVVFPFFLRWMGDFWYGVPRQESLSAYYFATPEPARRDIGGPVQQWVAGDPTGFGGMVVGLLKALDAEYPMRVWFVGALAVLGVSMILYEGFDKRENWLLNFAGFLALGVAIFPTECKSCGPINWAWGFPGDLHTLCAYAAFFCLFVLSVMHGAGVLVVRETSGSGAITRRRSGAGKYRGWYLAAAVLMLIFDPLARAYAWAFDLWARRFFWEEAFGLWAFAFYWGIKTVELRSDDRWVRPVVNVASAVTTPLRGAARAARRRRR